MTIRTGIGGWSYAGWRGGVFYPEDLPQRRELEYASGLLGAIEINATFYGRQKPESFRKWRAETPDGFVFALKGSKFVTNRRVLAEAGEGVRNFLDQGLVELGDKLGPICWQMASTKRFDAEDVAAFLDLLPTQQDGLVLRHALEVGHESFACAEFVNLARRAGVAIVWSEDADRSPIADRTAGFAYMRMQRMVADCPTGYSHSELTRIAALCRAWEAGEAPAKLPYQGDPAASVEQPGEVFAFLINGAKERAPAAALALADILKRK